MLPQRLQPRSPGGAPRRSFDLRARRLFDQLDEEEREVVARAEAESHRRGRRAGPEFRRHFVPLDLPLSDRGRGEYGLNALGLDLDFTCGGRIPRPERPDWFEYRRPDDWTRHDVGTQYRSDVGRPPWTSTATAGPSWSWPTPTIAESRVAAR